MTSPSDIGALVHLHSLAKSQTLTAFDSQARPADLIVDTTPSDSDFKYGVVDNMIPKPERRYRSRFTPLLGHRLQRRRAPLAPSQPPSLITISFQLACWHVVIEHPWTCDQ